MDAFLAISLMLLFLAYQIIIYRFNSTNRRNKLPPSPPSLPILGHFHILKKPLHRRLYDLSKRYGPVYSLKIGTRPVVVVTSPSIAEECFTKNDVVLANRPRFLIGKHIGYNYTNLMAAPYGDHWRNLRKVSAEDIFSVSRLNMSQATREDEIGHLLVRLSSECRPSPGGGFTKVEMRSLFKDLMLNNIMRMVAGKRYYGGGASASADDEREFTALIDELFRYGAGSNPADFFPLLKWIPGGRFTAGLERLGDVADKFVQGLVDEKRSKDDDEDKAAGSDLSMVDHLLSLQRAKPDYYTDEVIKGLALIIILTGTDTSYATMEWALSNLINYPDVLEKARQELDSRVGQDRLINEKDVSELPYLQNILSEVFRLYPATPLLVPHYSSSDCTIGGYSVPRDTIVFVNAWAIHRDPTLWDDPDSFKPERFQKDKVQSRKLLTFGMGRRACPGAGLAQRMVGLTLGSLIQCFEWKRTSEELVDMTEGAGVTMPRAKPLEVLCKTRPIVSKVLS